MSTSYESNRKTPSHNVTVPCQPLDLQGSTVLMLKYPFCMEMLDLASLDYGEDSCETRCGNNWLLQILPQAEWLK